MASVYTTRPGDMLDQICLRHYGRASGTVEQVLAANLHLGEPILKPSLEAGLSLTLPVLAVRAETRAPVRLWD